LPVQVSEDFALRLIKNGFFFGSDATGRFSATKIFGNEKDLLFNLRFAHTGARSDAARSGRHALGVE
jgi:hypothetical protein